MESFDDGVVEAGAYLFDGLVAAVGPGAISEKRDGEVALGVDPEGGASVAEVAEGSR